MALPPLRIEIGADTSDFNAAMTGAQTALDKIAAKMKVTVTETGRLTDEFGQTVRVTKAMRKELAAAGVSTDDLAADLLKLRDSAAQAKASNDNLATSVVAASSKMAQTGNGTRRFGSQIQNASYQVQDFSVQIASGTSATVALSQQLPQLLGGFGMMGAILGGAVAVIAALVREIDRTDGAVRRLLINLNILSSRSITEAETRIADLRATMERNNQAIAGTEEALRSYGNMVGINSDAERKYIEDLKKHNAEIEKQIGLEEKAIEKLKEGQKKPVEPGRTLRGTGRVRDGGPDFGGEGAGAASPATDAYTMQLKNRLQQVEEFTMTEGELLARRYADRQMALDEALANELLSEQAHAEQTRALREKNAQDIANIEAAKRNTMLGATSSLFGALANLAQQGGKKTAGIAKAFGIAEAIINTYVGATNALRTVPYPYNFVAAAAVIANGMASVASIMSVNTNGGSNSAALTTGGSAAAAAPAPLEVRLSGFGASDLFTGAQLGNLFERLQDEAGDRGLKFVGAAA